jgi:choline monooxygenase
MFVHDSHLPQLLAPQAYSSDERFARERAALLLPAWHCVASRADFARGNETISLSLLGYPILLRRVGEGYEARLDDRPLRSRSARRFVHASSWDDATTEPRIASPLEDGLTSTTFTAESVGQLVFVRLTENGISLREFLGPQYDRVREWFSEDYRQSMGYTAKAAANWKAYIENGLESYHIETVHAKTFICWPDESTCQHDLHERSTVFRTTHDDPRWNLRFADQMMRRALGCEAVPYEHVHVYPTFTFNRMTVFSYLESVLPVSARETEVVTRCFCHVGRHRNPIAWMTHRLGSRWGSRFLKVVQDEDMAILKACQGGLNSREHPRGGLISVREERIHHFQDYIRKSVPDVE